MVSSRDQRRAGGHRLCLATAHPASPCARGPVVCVWGPVSAKARLLPEAPPPANGFGFESLDTFRVLSCLLLGC